jgi:predicted enzyme related to lactoylglutathione lyase
VPTIQPIVVTAHIDRLQRFYTALLGGVQVRRTPDDGPVFYVGLRVGDSELGLVSDADAPADAPQRMLLSVDVDNVDALLDKVTELGGTVDGPPNDMPWGQRVAHVQDPDGNAINLTQDI